MAEHELAAIEMRARTMLEFQQRYPRQAQESYEGWVRGVAVPDLLALVAEVRRLRAIADFCENHTCTLEPSS